MIVDLSARLHTAFGSGFGVRNLASFREFSLRHPSLPEILHAQRARLGSAVDVPTSADIQHAVRARSEVLNLEHGASLGRAHATRSQSHRPGRLHPDLSWTHYRTLLRVERAEVRGFYEIEALANNWSARKRARQISNLQAFLLELGKGFNFVSRQERLTLDGDHFYVDLVFYHAILKCFVLIDLKTGKLTHGDLGQIQLYVTTSTKSAQPWATTRPSASSRARTRTTRS